MFDNFISFQEAILMKAVDGNEKLAELKLGKAVVGNSRCFGEGQ